MCERSLHTSPPNEATPEPVEEELHYFDHVVVGAGIVGSCTAWQLAKTGQSVLLVEQFPLPHTRGSSHGQTRIVRSCYTKDYHAALMPQSFEAWEEIEAESKTKLICHSGALFLTTNDDTFKKMQENMEKFAPQHLKILNQDELNKYICITYHDIGKAILDKSAGIVFADKALATIQDLFKKEGGHLWDSCEVSPCSLELGPRITFQVKSHRVVETPSLVVCAGAWTPELFCFMDDPDTYDHLSNLVKAEAVNVYYWQESAKGAYRDYPVILQMDDIYYFTSPSIEYPGMVKAGVHGGTRCNIDRRDEVEYPEAYVDAIKFFLRERFPYIVPTPAIIEKCMYSVTPDEDFILDHLPGHKNVLLACGFSGSGFKKAPLIGKVLCALALRKKSPADVSHFSLSRFERKET